MISEHCAVRSFCGAVYSVQLPGSLPTQDKLSDARTRIASSVSSGALPFWENSGLLCILPPDFWLQKAFPERLMRRGRWGLGGKRRRGRLQKGPRRPRPLLRRALPRAAGGARPRAPRKLDHEFQGGGAASLSSCVWHRVGAPSMLIIF